MELLNWNSDIVWRKGKSVLSSKVRIRIHWCRIRSTDYGPGSSILGWIPIRIRVFLTKNWKTFIAEKNILYFIFFWLKCNFLILVLHKRRPSYRRTLQPSKENIQHFKTWHFFLFLRVFFALLDPDPDPLTLFFSYLFLLRLAPVHMLNDDLHFYYLIISPWKLNLPSGSSLGAREMRLSAL